MIEVTTLQDAAARGLLQRELAAALIDARRLRTRMLMAGRHATGALRLLEQGHYGAVAELLTDIAQAASEVES